MFNLSPWDRLMLRMVAQVGFAIVCVALFMLMAIGLERITVKASTVPTIPETKTNNQEDKDMIPPSETQIRQYAEAVADCFDMPDDVRQKFIDNLIKFTENTALREISEERMNIDR